MADMQESGWTSMEDAAPPCPGYYLCWYEYFRYGDHDRLHRTYEVGYYINGIWSGEVTRGVRCKVLYWHPLPSPPPGEKGEA